MVNGAGRSPYGFSLNPKVIKAFMKVIKEKGMVGSRQIELLMIDFVRQNTAEKKEAKGK